MPVKCLVDNKMFYTLAEVGDHIFETNEGMQGEWLGFGSEMPTSDEVEQMSDAIRGFSHIKYINHNGESLPSTLLYVPLMAGHKWCTECRLRFKNNFTLYEHMIKENHGTDMMLEHSKKDFDELKEFQKKWF